MNYLNDEEKQIILHTYTVHIDLQRDGRTHIHTQRLSQSSELEYNITVQQERYYKDKISNRLKML